jgi:glutamate/tyrosine decarboxylase-like PLP-dependent enzyme
MNPLEISPDQLRHVLDEVSKLAMSYLEKLDSQPTLPKISGTEAQQMFQSEWPKEGLKGEALALLNSVLQNSRAQNGRFFGYVLGSGEPVAAAADLLVSILNQNVTAWRSSPAAVAVENTVVSGQASP